MHPTDPLPVYLPDNEPYLGRESVFQFDNVIVPTLEASARVAAYTRQHELDGLQSASSVIIPQAINLSLAIRELIRQGYLFAALTLVRPLIERTATIAFLLENPNQLTVWERGWLQSERPGLKTMLKCMSGGLDTDVPQQICELFGQVVHGNPAAAVWNAVDLGDEGLGYSVGKVVDNPELCDFVCFQCVSYLVVLQTTMRRCFPEV